MTVTKSVIIQADATIITGILILLTIQSISNPTIEELIFEGAFLEEHLGNLHEFKANLTSQIDITGSKYEEMLNEKIIEKQLEVSELKAKVEALQKVTRIPFGDPNLLAGILVVPFAISMIIEVIHGVNHPEISKPHTVSLAFLIVGLMYLAALIFMNGIFS